MNAEILDKIKEILAVILDVEKQGITAETYIIRSLGAESIDLLEVAVSLNSEFKVNITENDIFLIRLREQITEAEEQGRDTGKYLAKTLPFLPRSRIDEILKDLDGGPVLKVKDIVCYIDRAIK